MYICGITQEMSSLKKNTSHLKDIAVDVTIGLSKLTVSVYAIYCSVFNHMVCF